MKILPIPPLNAQLTRVIKLVEISAFEHANQRHLLHYFLKGLGDLPTIVLEQLNRSLKAPTSEQYPYADAHMRLIIGLNHKLKPPIQIANLVQLRQKFATEMVAIQSPSVWQQPDTDDHVESKDSDNIENGNLVSWQDKTIANADGGEMIIRCYHAESSATQSYEQNHYGYNNDEKIVVLFFHGGGFCLGNLDTDHEFCHAVCAQTGWAIVSVDYRLAPEYPAPTAIRDCLEAYSWLAKHAHTLGSSSARIILAGDSSGGGLAALVAQQVSNATINRSFDRQKYMNTLDDFTIDIFQQLENLPRPLAQLLLYPVTDIGENYPSWKLYGQGLILDYNDIKVFHAAYLQDSSLTQPHALLSPIHGDNTQVCPSYIVAAELDILRDEALVYAKQLQDDGINVQTRTVLGAPHGFIDLMSVHRGAGRETYNIIDRFAIFVRQIINLNLKVIELE